MLADELSLSRCAERIDTLVELARKIRRQIAESLRNGTEWFEIII